jgi:NAD(P)-dependent dehydrogenase (short-subunit alcohol dehydrogenase family)
MTEGSIVVVGGTRAIGLEIVRHYVEAGEEVVLTGRDQDNIDAAVAELGGRARGVRFDLAEPTTIAAALADVGPVRRLVVVAIDRDSNTIDDYDIERAIRLVTLKLVGYTEVIHTLRTRLTGDASIVLFGGMAKERPYPGSTTVSTVNGGVVGLARSLVSELRPLRINTIHPGIVGDSPYWHDKPAAIARAASQTPTGRLARMEDVVGAVVFLLENEAMNGFELMVDGGWHTGILALSDPA